MKPRNGKCIYCGATHYGVGCPYSPTGVHVIPSANKCAYCGSPMLGLGCPYSPSGRHVRFADFGMLQAEQVNNFMITSFISEKIKRPFENTQAYKLGIINNQGIKIKEPSTIEEKMAYTPLDQYVFKLKRIYGKQLDALNTDLYIENAFKFAEDEKAITENWDPVKYSKQVELEENLKLALANIQELFYNLLIEANQNGLSTTIIERIMLETITENEFIKDKE